MRAAIYARVSSDPRGLGRSTSDQVEDCQRICEFEGWEVLSVLVDNNRGASRWADVPRPAYEELEGFIRTSSIDVLVTWEASRAQRDLEAYVQMRELCRKNGVLWSYSGRTYDLSRTDDAFTTGLDALLAEREASVTRDRILRAIRLKVEKGKPHGRVPFGYRRIYDEKTGALIRQEPDPDVAPLVLEICQRVDAGESLRGVAADLNARGISTPLESDRGWIMQSIRRICLSPVLAGKVVHHGEVVGDGEWEAIIPEDLHLRLQSKLKDPSRRMMREGKVVHLLSNIALCGVCDSPVTVMKNRGNPAYTCRKAFHVSRVESKVDPYVEAVVVARLSQPDVDLTSGADESLKKAVGRLSELRSRLDSFYDAAALGEITPAALARIEAKLLAEIDQVEASVRPRSQIGALAGVIGPDAQAVWDSRPIAAKRSIIRALMTIHIHPVGAGRRTFDPKAIEIRWLDVGQQPAQ